MHLSTDEILLFDRGAFKLNATIAYTWGLMLVLIVIGRLATRGISGGRRRSRWSNLVEVVVITLLAQLREIGLASPAKYLPFLGTLFLFLALATLGTLLPGYEPPTGSLSTTVALALCVFAAVPVFGIRERGVVGYLKGYLEPVPILLPFHLVSELFRTVALSVRLFGNMMSGAMIVAILLTVVPFVFPLLMIALGLLTGMVQAYIFTTLAAVYIAAATQGHQPAPDSDQIP